MTMKSWQKTLITLGTSIYDATRIIDEVGLRVALVVDDNKKLLGMMTDIEVRRALLAKVSMDVAVDTIMNATPFTVGKDYDQEELLKRMQKKAFNQVPVLDENGIVVDLLLIDELASDNSLDNLVVLMAGGLGSRLKPLTNDCPKPLLKVGGKPILENIIDGFSEFGFKNFIVSLNYKAEMIRQYFGAGEKYNVDIQYLEENKRLGTAGALSLLQEKPGKPIIVMNADLLTKVNYRQLLNYHKSHNNIATMCVREYDVSIPYGVVRTHEGSVTGIQEKPVERFFVNAGIYVLEPEALDYIPHDTYFDITTLFEHLLEIKKTIGSFPLREYWLDIGHPQDFAMADEQFEEVFA
ncbi:MAG: alcohol dehydrogenase [marine bacterium B5-7]|nr:MAG: alcohol dehydrogenase [marine bacterium B5-7]